MQQAETQGASYPFHRVSGTPRDIGAAIGRIAAPAYHDVVTQLEWFGQLRQHWGGTAEFQNLLKSSRAVFPQYVQELEAMAEAMDAVFEDLFLWNCRGDLPLASDDVEDECTTVMFAARDGRPALIAHNEDYDPYQAPHCFMLEVEQQHGPRIVSFSYPGTIIGHTLACNDAGLVLTCNNVRWPHAPQDAQALPRYLLARAVLDCTNLDTAIDTLTRKPRAGAFHHNLGTADGARLVSVETTVKGSSVQDVTDRYAHANHLVHPDMSAMDDFVKDNSASRQDRADAMLADVSPDKAGGLSILYDQENRDHPIYRRGGLKDNGYTIVSSVFEISDSALEWEVYDNPVEIPVLRGSMPG